MFLVNGHAGTVKQVRRSRRLGDAYPLLVIEDKAAT